MRALKVIKGLIEEALMLRERYIMSLTSDEVYSFINEYTKFRGRLPVTYLENIQSKHNFECRVLETALEFLYKIDYMFENFKNTKDKEYLMIGLFVVYAEYKELFVELEIQCDNRGKLKKG